MDCRSREQALVIEIIKEDIIMGITTEEVKKQIEEGRTVLGIELGSTRIKAVLVGEDNAPIASGAHDWENRLGRTAGLL